MGRTVRQAPLCHEVRRVCDEAALKLQHMPQCFVVHTQQDELTHSHAGTCETLLCSLCCPPGRCSSGHQYMSIDACGLLRMGLTDLFSSLQLTPGAHRSRLVFYLIDDITPQTLADHYCHVLALA